MAEPEVLHQDLELFLTGWIREKLAARPELYAQDVEVDNVEPPENTDFPRRLIVVRSDGTTRTSIITDEASVGVSVLAGTQDNPQDAIDLALLVRALLIPCTDGPVAAVLTFNGPYAVTEQQPRARRYMTCTMSVVGGQL